MRLRHKRAPWGRVLSAFALLAVCLQPAHGQSSPGPCWTPKNRPSPPCDAPRVMPAPEPGKPAPLPKEPLPPKETDQPDLTRRPEVPEEPSLSPEQAAAISGETAVFTPNIIGDLLYTSRSASFGSSVVTIPPSPVVMCLIGWVLKIVIVASLPRR